MLDLGTLIRDIPDFPKKGILFKDITTLLKDPAAFKQAIDQLTDLVRELRTRDRDRHGVARLHLRRADRVSA